MENTIFDYGDDVVVLEEATLQLLQKQINLGVAKDYFPVGEIGTYKGTYDSFFIIKMYSRSFYFVESKIRNAH